MNRIAALGRLVGRQHAGALAWSAALYAALALTEGIGLLSLLPALQAVGIAGSDGAAGGVVRRAFAFLGLTPSLWSALAVVVAAIVLRAGVQAAYGHAQSALQASVVSGLRVRLFAAVIRLPWRRFVAERPAALMQVVGPHVDDVHASLDLAQQVAAQGATLLAAAAVGVTLSPLVTGVVVGAGIALVIAGRFIRLPGRAAGDALLALGTDVQVRATELLGAAKMIKAWRADERAVARFATDAQGWAGQTRHWASRRALGGFALTSMGAVALAALCALAVAQQLPPASLLLLLLVSARVLPQLLDVQHAASHFWQSSAAIVTVSDLLARTEHFAVDAAAPVGAMTRAPGVALRDVSVRYDGAASYALRGVSADVAAGSFTAVVGASGAGKSTLVDVMLGLLDPAEGTVQVDGVPAEQAFARAGGSRVGYLAQEPMLLHGTVRENLRFALPDADDAALSEALHAAAADFVWSLPGGLDAPIGDRGALLSGGERQRLALARALVGRPLLLVLDEATSAVDADAERRILDALRALRGRVTIVFCSHRDAVREAADAVIAL